MISIKLQKILVFFPLLNCSIIFIAFFINSKYMKDDWCWVLIKYMFLGFVLSIPFILLFGHFEDIFTLDLSLITFYIFSLINSAMLVYAQKKLLINNNK